MRKRKTREERQKDLSSQAKEEYSRHIIAEHPTEGRWRLMRPRDDGEWDWVFASEIIADLWAGGLYVGGDTQIVIFKSGPEHPEARVRWMGSRSSANDCYFVEKAIIGSGREGIEVYDGDIAYEDLSEIQDEIAEDVGSRESEVIDAIEDIKRTCLDMSQHEVIRDLMGTGVFDTERVCDVGIVVSPRVYYAHAALARLCELLDQKEKETHGRSPENRTA